MLLVEPLQLVFPTLVSQTLLWTSTMFTSFQIYKYSWLPPQSRSRMIRTAWRLVIASVTTWWRSAGQPAVAGGSPRYPQYTTSTSIQVPNVSTMPRRLRLSLFLRILLFKGSTRFITSLHPPMSKSNYGSLLTIKW